MRFSIERKNIMVQKPEIQYIHQFYVYGSEAQVPELKPVKKKKAQKLVLPVPKLERNFLIAFDVASLCGILVACVMMVLLTVGIHQLSVAQQDYNRMESHVIQLQNTNVELEKDYRSLYDLNDIREKALAIGMIPVEEAKTVSIRVELPQAEPEPTVWENICWFFTELFA